MRNLNELNAYRRCEAELRLYGVLGDGGNGVFEIQHNGSALWVLASNGEGWDHVSVSTQTRCPTWDEMEAVRKLFAKSTEVWMQLHVPEKAHVNFHPFCLHLWRPQHRAIPCPPSILVGPKLTGERR